MKAHSGPQSTRSANSPASTAEEESAKALRSALVGLRNAAQAILCVVEETETLLDEAGSPKQLARGWFFRAGGRMRITDKTWRRCIQVAWLVVALLALWVILLTFNEHGWRIAQRLHLYP